MGDGGRRVGQRDEMEAGGKIQSKKGILSATMIFEDVERRPWAKECRWLLEAGKNPYLTASKELGMSVGKWIISSNSNKQGNGSSPIAYRKELSHADNLILDQWQNDFRLINWRIIR